MDGGDCQSVVIVAGTRYVSFNSQVQFITVCALNNVMVVVTCSPLFLFCCSNEPCQGLS